MNKDPLTDLLVDKQELDRKTLAEILAQYSKLDKSTGQVILTPAFAKLANAGKILVFLLARKAAKNLSLPMEHEEATPMEISSQTGMNYDSVKPTVSLLYKKRVLAKSGKSYYVPDHAILSAREFIEKTSDRGG
jgi:hypothetical protein